MMFNIKSSSIARNSSTSGFSISLCLIIFYAFFILEATIGNSGSNEAVDKMALLAIKAGISHDPFSVMKSWSSNDTLHFCKWQGVTCGRRHQRVTALDLRSSKLTGILSSYIGNLSFLLSLNLVNNSFMGAIPPEISGLRRLQRLHLNNNSFGGEIPSNISACSSLISLELDYNKLVGAIPPELGSLAMLRNISLISNHLTGTIPSSMGNLSSLHMISLTFNELEGKIPDSLGRLKNLISLSLGGNKLSGVVPLSIFNMSSLVLLELGENYYLEGTLPLDLGIKLQYIKIFSIANNRFTGPIPTSSSNFSNLHAFQLSGNYFHGQVPLLHNVENLLVFSIFQNSLGTGNEADDLKFVSSLANATRLSAFDISGNKFAGKFSEILCNFTMLAFLNLGNNSLRGEVPTCIQNLEYLQFLSVQNNLLFGAIPSSIGKLQKLGRIYLTNNQLSGFIPTTIGNMTQLYALYLAKNNLQGEIPSTLGNCSNLIALDLFGNNLSGSIPSQIFSLSSLTVGLDLSNNNLTGPIPTKVWDIGNLNYLALQNNKLQGVIPTTLSTCLQLETLYLGGNLFEGSIPTALMTLKSLLELDLSGNNLSGSIPRFLESLNLKMLNLSYNNFEGLVPTGGIFSTTNFSVVGNKRLCGGIPQLKLPQCDVSKASQNHKKKLIVIIISCLCGVILFAAVVSIYKFSHGKRNRAFSTMSALENASFTHLSYQSLLKATNGFSINNLIGSGTFGLVYKGTLDEDQTIVAVKKFNLEVKAAFKSFMAECGALQNIRHRNLVKVITACSGIDYQGNDFKALVYEYMENGSLHDWLHPKPLVDVVGEPRILNLYQRFNIAADIAFALEYLHHQCGTPIVHCDLKPSNVLLDSEMVARVGDFGLAKFLSRSEILSPHGNQSSSIEVRGTVGYTAPEYGMGNEVSTQGDVYSFGILLLELFTGKTPVDAMFKEGLSLRQYVKAALPDQITDILDHHLYEDLVGPEDNKDVVAYARSSSREETNKEQERMTWLESLISILEIAITCSEENPQERMNMSDVASKLSSIKSKLIGTPLRQQRRNLAG